MKRTINQINVSITTNRTCTLQCTHCYIAPHLFKDKTQMTEAVYRQVFDRIEELYEIDQNLDEIEWEVIGGETTMMPFEWWERQLPWTLDRIGQFNKKLKIPGALNFLTNLIYADKRYTGLFNEYGQHPLFCLYTSWEPDTQRFGKRNQLFDRFYETLKSIDSKQKILDIILTKAIIEMGAERILDLFLPAGITDFSMKMISPYGSGKAFFEPNMAEFHEMSQFFSDMNRLKPDHVTFTPQEEMLSSLMKNTSFQCNGNFKYDLSIEPDGVCHFNANQTADEAALGFRRLLLDDPDWAYKTCFENKIEENNKLSLLHPECDQCEYLMHCNAGWYHYKIHDPKVIDLYRKKDCSGHQLFWDASKERLGSLLGDRTEQLHMNSIKQIMRSSKPRHGAEAPLAESALGRKYQDYFEAIKGIKVIHVDRAKLFGKRLIERLWFYDDLRIEVTIDDDLLVHNPDYELIMEHFLSSNYHSIRLSDDQVARFLEASVSKTAMRARVALGALLVAQQKVCATSSEHHGLVLDNRNEELFRSLYAWQIRSGSVFPGIRLESSEQHYLSALLHNLNTELDFYISFNDN